MKVLQIILWLSLSLIMPPLLADNPQNQNEAPNLSPELEDNTDNDNYKLLNNWAVPVIASPYIGERSEFDGSHLITNFSDINRDRSLLELWQQLDNAAQQPIAPLVVLSGTFEGLAILDMPAGSSTRGDIAIDEISLVLTARVNPWITLLTEFEFQDTPFEFEDTTLQFGRVDLKQAFATLGNFNYSKFYATIGNFYVPFGRHTGYLITDPLTKQLGRTKGDAVLAGYRYPSNSGPFAAIYALKNNLTDRRSNSPAYGLNLGTKFKLGETSGEIGAGFISDLSNTLNDRIIADQFGQGPDDSFHSPFKQKIPALNANGRIDIYNLSFVAEYIETLKNLHPQDLSFDGQRAKPNAVNIQSAYYFDISGRPASYVLTYGFTNQAANLALPKQRIITGLALSWWENTEAILEFRRDFAYSHDIKAPNLLAKTGNTLALQVAYFY